MEKGSTTRLQWEDPKVHICKGKIVNDCESPCSSAVNGRKVHILLDSYWMFLIIQRGTDASNNLYKIGTVIERTIGYIKRVLVFKERKFSFIKTSLV